MPVTAKAGTLEFSLDLPMSLLQPPETGGDYVTWEVQQAWTDTPGFTVQLRPAPLPAQHTGASEPFGSDAAERAIVRAELLPEGGYLNVDQRKDKKYVMVEVCRPVPSGRLCCTVQQRASEPIAGFAELVGLAEKVCTSMKPKA